MSNLRERAAGGQDVARRDQPQPPASIGALIQSLRGEIARALPKHMDADRMARIALTAVRKTPDLARATPESFMGALLTCSQLGLEPNGPTGEAYLVPYEHKRGPLAGKVECQLIVGYQGWAKLFFQSPIAKHLDAQVVYERDDFDYAYGLDPYLRHKPARGDRGRIIYYYAVASLQSGASAFAVLTPEEVKDIRKGLEGPRDQKIGDPQHWMERKVVLKQALKLLPKSTDLARVMGADESIRTDLSLEGIDTPRVIDGEWTEQQPAAGHAGGADLTPDNPIVDVEDPPEEPDWPDVAPVGEQ
jgi:recombination protein RecT